MESERYTRRYDDIIALPHHVSRKRAKMSLSERAAQFAPFAALTGYGDAVRETARYTKTKIEPEEDAREELDRRLKYVSENIGQRPELDICYFIPDEKKEGGSYVTLRAAAERIDLTHRLLITQTGETVPLDDILSIDGEIFGRLD